MKVDLLSLLPEEAEAFVVSLGEPKFRAKQIFDWLMKGKNVSDMQNLPMSLRNKLEEHCLLTLPKVLQKQVSKVDGTVKYLFKLHDGACVESVLMRYEHGNSLCISSQVGCRMGCRFCASTLGGKERDLLASEMLGQIIAAAADSGSRVSHVVMMGIGEPLDNYDNALRFLHLANHPARLGISYRNISLSTCGVADGIDRLADEALPITLSVSLHNPTDEGRSAIMPINRRFPIAVLLASCKRYFEKTGRRISFEYTLLSSVNDSEADAKTLAQVLRKHLGNMPIHVNLIRLNEVKEREFKTPDAKSVEKFIATLERSGIVATLRRRLGADIDAACGQLRRKNETTSQEA